MIITIVFYKPSIKTIAKKTAKYSVENFNDNKNAIIFYENNFQHC